MAFRKYLDRPHVSLFLAGEDRARSERRGIWKETHPEPPWEFRKRTRIFGTPESAAEWLKTPIGALGNAQPIEFLDTFAGIEAVKADLMRLKHGVVS